MRRPSLTILKSALLSFFVVLFLKWTFFSHNDNDIGRPLTVQEQNEAILSQVNLWKQLRPLLEANAPGCDPPERTEPSGAIGFDAQTTLERPDLMRMDADDTGKMRRAHTNFVQVIKQKVPHGAYIPGTSGLVSTAGGSYLAQLVISLKMTRKTGNKLPMEVFLGNMDEYDAYVCEEVLPSLNARCVLLSDILHASPPSTSISHYQFKVFAILFSSFENVMFLDADCFAVQDIKHLIKSEPFVSSGMVTWPDFWMNTASPLYYYISSQSIPPLGIHASTESGELLVSKKRHHFSLLLSTYYNYYGPDYFYPLLSQGGPGEGDKETFIAAATALGEPYYMTSQGIRAIGHVQEGGRWAGSAMVQYNPIRDYLRKKAAAKGTEDRAPPPQPFFIHANFPKFDPATVFNSDHESQPTRGRDGEPARAWDFDEETIESFGFDVEHVFWKQIGWAACELEGKFSGWDGQSGMCDRVKKHLADVFG